MTNLLQNGYFEGGTSRDNMTGSPITQVEGPAGWVVWWAEDPGALVFRPESQIIKAEVPYLVPPRVFHGNQAWKVFKTYGRIICGLWQVVSGLTPGREYDLRAYAHAWSSHYDQDLGTIGPCSDADNPHCSAGVGTGGHFILEGEAPPLNRDPVNDAIGNFVFRVAISHGPEPVPQKKDLLIRGRGAHIYNQYAQIPELRFKALETQAVIYVGIYTQWAYKHNDAYLDSVVLEEVPIEPPPPGSCRGRPREQYERTYLLLPPSYGQEWRHAAVDGTEKTKNTIGNSADDAGIGDLDVRIVKAVNPGVWANGDRSKLKAYFADHYPGVDYQEVLADSPAALVKALTEASPDPPAPPVYPEPGHAVGLHLQGTWPGWDDYVAITKPGVVKLVGNIELARTIKALSPKTVVVYRHHLQDQKPLLTAPDKRKAARDFIAMWREALEINAQWVDVMLGLNEYIGTADPTGMANAMEWVTAWAYEFHALGLPTVPGLGSVAIGNPQHGDEVRQMAPMAQAAIDTGGVIFYHGYWGPFEVQNTDKERYFYHLAGRCLESWDPTWAAMGLDTNRIRYALGEAGVVGHWDGDPSKGFNPGAGWRHPQAYNGDLGLFSSDLMTLDRLIAEWNAAHGNRCLGAVVFTTGPDFVGWPWFQFRDREMVVMKEKLIRAGRV